MELWRPHGGTLGYMLREWALGSPSTSCCPCVSQPRAGPAVPPCASSHGCVTRTSTSSWGGLGGLRRRRGHLAPGCPTEFLRNPGAAAIRIPASQSGEVALRREAPHLTLTLTPQLVRAGMGLEARSEDSCPDAAGGKHSGPCPLPPPAPQTHAIASLSWSGKGQLPLVI